VKLRRLVAAILGLVAGALLASGLAAVLFLVFAYGSASKDYRDIVLGGFAGTLAIFGAIVGCVTASIPRLGLVGLTGCVALFGLVMAGLCAAASATRIETALFVALGLAAVTPAGIAGWLMNKKLTSARDSPWIARP
jgi:cadmium resistance protein CadD (predicted permease)